MPKQKYYALIISTSLSAIMLSNQALADENPVALETVTVTADPLGQRNPDQITTPVTVLSGQRLEQKKSGNLGQTLDGEPGVASASFGAGVGRPVIRGMVGSRVQVLGDGLEVTDVSAEGGDHNVAMDPADADQIEILRGPATLLYGSGSTGGVINVKSKDFDPEIADAPSFSQDLGYGYNGDDRRSNSSFDLPLGEHFVLRGNYGLRRTNNFDIDGFQQLNNHEGPKDELQNSFINNDEYGLTGLYSNDWGFAGLKLSHYKTDYGTPVEDPLLNIGEEAAESIEASYDRADFRSEINDPFSGFKTLRLKVAYTDFTQDEFDTSFLNGIKRDKSLGTGFKNRKTEARIELEHNEFYGWNGVIGGQFSDRDFDAAGSDGESFYVRQNKTNTAALFLLENHPMSFGNIELASRIDRVGSKPGSLNEERKLDLGQDAPAALQNPNTQSGKLKDRDFTLLSLSAGSVFNIDKQHNFKVSLSHSERAPAPNELYAFGFHDAAGTVEVGDPNLSKESYNNFEVGFNRNNSDIRYNTTFYYNDVSDFIYQQSFDDGAGNAYRAPVGDESGLLLFNKQANAKFYGTEISGAWDVIKGAIPLTLRASGDYVRGQLKSGENLPRMTPGRLGIGADTSYKNMTFSADFRHVFEQNEIAPLETSTKGYNLLSLYADWKPENNMTIYVKGNNLLNVDGRQHTSYVKDNAPIIGRTIFAGIKFNLDG